MLQACLNGDRLRSDHPALPITAEQLARDAEAVVRAGANELHVHPRGADGLESLEPQDVAAAVLAIRAAVPGIQLGLSTRSPIRPGGRERHQPMRSWSVRPDYVSVNLVEEDAPDVISLMLDMGIGIEAGLWSKADAIRFVGLPDAARCLRVLIEINEQDEAEGLEVCRAITEVLDSAGSTLPRLLHGYEATKWSIYRESLRLGLDARVGFEDGFLMPTGERASDNAALIAAARKIAV
ncbi:3-keto-5-aminohexanoate cleavage protein [Mesorhizobium sp. DCY119]|uniref:3-keto-5-aminohexanoate cleavage protein n=1 Tax=Mesorhizobium sp. DCY119 TaxID=2108445 RepID=UPI000E6B7A66|nr:3-keto-5-aminohexanoate cleavage protein [Mesorhizobium sp. DCY119]RJG44555.1 hypothetical protein D3Y55_09940 [Mesorhizobium sp. DCY119]